MPMRKTKAWKSGWFTGQAMERGEDDGLGVVGREVVEWWGRCFSNVEARRLLMAFLVS